MKLGKLIIRSLSGSTLLLVLTTLFTPCIGPAHAATEPGAITIALLRQPDNLDPGNTIVSDIGKVLLKNVVETLTEINPDDSSIIPKLATSWRQINQNTWQFSLRKGVKFHDGRDFNAEAVLFNIKRLYDKRINSRNKSKFFGHLKMDGKALDSHTVEVMTDKFEPLLPTLMGTFAMCSPATPLDKWTLHPLGTGPYRFVKWDAGTQIILERFDEYWGSQPQVKKATYVWRSESSVLAAMVLMGEADLAPSIAVQDANRPDMDRSYFNSETSYLRIGTWEAPLNDRRVRMALNYAIDRNAIRGSILSKDVIPATQMIVPGIFGYNPDLKVWEYNPQKARALLEEARKDGVLVDREILLVGQIGHYPGSAEISETVMAMWRAIGLNVKLRILDQGVYLSYRDKPYAKGVGPFIIHHKHDNNNGDAVFTVFGKYHCDGNQSPICDKLLDEMIEKAQVATGEERRRLWQAVFKRLHEDIVCDAMLFHLVGFTRVGKRINFKPSIATNSEVPLAQITFKE
jgi:peptide/nickel transport system substrate-binding protein